MRCSEGEDDRTAEDRERFGRALGGINAWYGCQKAHVLLVNTALPDGHAYENKQPYGGRGWCIGEVAMSSITKDDTALLDLSKLSGRETTLQELRQHGKAGRRAPMAPDAFHSMLEAGVADGSIKFTYRGDVAKVTSIYEKAFLDEMGGATALYYPALGWGDAEASALAQALTFAAARGALALCQTLYLNNNNIGDAGMTAFAQAIKPVSEGGSGALSQLKELQLYSNRIGDVGMTAFAQAIKPASEGGSGALPQLIDLGLGENNIGDVGMKAFAQATKPVSAGGSGALASITHLSFTSNHATDEGKKAMRDVAEARGFSVYL